MMILQLLPQAFSVCQLAPDTAVNTAQPFTFTARTDTEWSLVCPTAQVPSVPFKQEDGWRALRVQGSMEFSLVGILAGISTCLAQAGVSIFAISTFDTDYVLLKEAKLAAALDALKNCGYAVK